MSSRSFQNDISRNENIIELYENSVCKKWIKPIPMDKTVFFEEYNKKQYFIPVADIILDTELYSTGRRTGEKRRKTLLQFIPKISKELFSKKKEWLYIITINGRVIKIGGTRTSLKDRCCSYLCGHHTLERGKSGKNSPTNAFIYNTLLFYLQSFQL